MQTMLQTKTFDKKYNILLLFLLYKMYQNTEIEWFIWTIDVN